jgi:hypothetical protein
MQWGWMLRMWTIVLILAVIVACIGTYVTFAYEWETQVPAYLWYTGMWLLLFLAYWIHSSTSHIHHQSPSATVLLHSQTPSRTTSGAPAQKLEVDHPKIKTSNDSQWDWMLIITIILWVIAGIAVCVCIYVASLPTEAVTHCLTNIPSVTDFKKLGLEEKFALLIHLMQNDPRY